MDDIRIDTIVAKVQEKKDVCANDVDFMISQMLLGMDKKKATAFLEFLHQKGETSEEIEGACACMQRVMIKVPISINTLDIVGTGGDLANTVNISTGASIIAASMGVFIAKHGNRSSSSNCGSADVLEELGISIQQTPRQVANSIKKIGIGFMFAPCFHPAMKKVATIRKSLSIRTIFNLLGPLLNPSTPKRFLIGVSNQKYLQLFADILQKRKVERAFVVCANGIDEITPIGPCDIIEIYADKQKKYVFDPSDLAIPRCSLKDLQGGDKQTNAKLLLDALAGKSGPILDTLCLNAAFAAYCFGIVESLAEGYLKAKETVEKKLPLQLLDKWRRVGC